MVARTSVFEPVSGSAVDPLVTEATWVAWKLTAVDPSQVNDGVVRGVNGSFDGMVERSWRPGRSLVLSEMRWDPASECLSVYLAIGMLGETDTTRAEADALAGQFDDLLQRPPYLAERVDPLEVVPPAARLHRCVPP